MSKFKFPKIKKLRIGNYLRELSVVIIGVAVTFYVSGLIESIREKKDIKAQLSAIHEELSYNVVQLEELYNFYDTHEMISKQLRIWMPEPEKANNDSIKELSRRIGQSCTFVYKKGAYELFERSGALKSFKNRKLLLKISDCYTRLETDKESYQGYYDLKINEIQKLYSTDTQLLIEDVALFEVPEARGIFNFYLAVSRDADWNLIKDIQEIMAEINDYIN